MNDLDRRFEALDSLTSTDLAEEIDRRAALPEPAPLPERAHRRIAAGLIAAALFTAVSVLAWSAFRPIDDPSPVGRSPEPSPSLDPSSSPIADAWRGVKEGTTQLSPPPTIRDGDVRVWTGAQLIVWGGNKSRAGDPPHANDGWALDARTRDWAEIEASPLSSRSWSGAAWTGNELVIWGGASGSWPGESPLGDGAAYDPDADTWRLLPPAPIPANAPLVSAWTGSEVIFWGSVQGEGFGFGAAYDPAADTWRRIADPAGPMTDSVTSAWAGNELIVVGGNGRKRYANAAAYDPAADRWRALPNGGLDGNAVAIGSIGGGVIGVDYNKHAALFEGDQWRDAPDLPTASCEDYPTILVTSSDVAVAELCSDLAYLRLGEGRWSTVSRDAGLASAYAAVGEVILVLTYEDVGAWEEGLGRLLAFRPPTAEGALSDAQDLAIAFAALRSDYPFDSDIPERIEAEARTMLSPEGAAAWEAPNMPAFWSYYTGSEVLSVSTTEDGRFEAVIRMTPYEGPPAIERIVMAPGPDLDGVARDLVVVDAEPG